MSKVRLPVFLPSEKCNLCHGKGWYVYGAIGRQICRCRRGITLPYTDWHTLGRPKTREEYDKRQLNQYNPVAQFLSVKERTNMKKLILKMTRVGSTLVGWVAHQDESLRLSGLETGSITRSGNTYYIKSRGEPRLISKTLYICGSELSADKQVFAYQYNSVDEAADALDAFREIVHQLNRERKMPPEAMPDMETLE